MIHTRFVPLSPLPCCASFFFFSRDLSVYASDPSPTGGSRPSLEKKSHLHLHEHKSRFVQQGGDSHPFFLVWALRSHPETCLIPSRQTAVTCSQFLSAFSNVAVISWFKLSRTQNRDRYLHIAANMVAEPTETGGSDGVFSVTYVAASPVTRVASSGKSWDLAGVITMIEEVVQVLQQEQADDDDKKACGLTASEVPSNGRHYRSMTEEGPSGYYQTTMQRD